MIRSLQGYKTFANNTACLVRNHKGFRDRDIVKFGNEKFEVQYDEDYLLFVYKKTPVVRIALQGILAQRPSMLRPTKPICHYAVEVLTPDEDWVEYGFIEGFYDITDVMTRFVDNDLDVLELTEPVKND